MWRRWRWSSVSAYVGLVLLIIASNRGNLVLASNQSSLESLDGGYYRSRFLPEDLPDCLQKFLDLAHIWEEQGKSDSLAISTLKTVISLLSFVLPSLPPTGKETQFSQACKLRQHLIDSLICKENNVRINLQKDRELARHFASGIIYNLLGNEKELPKPLQSPHQMNAEEINRPLLQTSYYYLLKTLILQEEIKESRVIQTIISGEWLKLFSLLLYSPDPTERSIVGGVLKQIFYKVQSEPTDLSYGVVQTMLSIVSDPLEKFHNEQTKVNCRPIAEIIKLVDAMIEKLWFHPSQGSFLQVYKWKVIPLIQYSQNAEFVQPYAFSCRKILEYCHQYGLKQLAREINTRLVGYSEKLLLKQDGNVEESKSVASLLVKLFADGLITGNVHFLFLHTIFQYSVNAADQTFQEELIAALTRESILETFFPSSQSDFYYDSEDQRKNVMGELIWWTASFYLGGTFDGSKAEGHLCQILSYLLTDSAIVKLANTKRALPKLLELVKNKMSCMGNCASSSSLILGLDEEGNKEGNKSALEELESDLQGLENMLNDWQSIFLDKGIILVPKEDGKRIFGNNN